MHRVFVAAWLLVVAGSSVPQSSEVQTLTSKAQVSPPLLVIVAAATTGSDIKLAVLRNAFEGYKTEFHGKTLIPFNQESGSQARERFDRLVLGLSPAQVGQFWVDQRVRSGSQPPRALPSPELTLRVIASLPSSIGYVMLDPKAVPAGLKALSIDGKSVADSDYPFAAK